MVAEICQLEADLPDIPDKRRRHREEGLGVSYQSFGFEICHLQIPRTGAPL